MALLLGGERVAAALPDRFVEPPCPAGETEGLRREIRSLSRALARAGDARERLEAQKDRSQALMDFEHGLGFPYLPLHLDEEKGEVRLDLTHHRRPEPGYAGGRRHPRLRRVPSSAR